MRCSGIGKQQHGNSLLWFQKGSVFFQWIRSWFLFVETRLESQHVACKVATFIWISKKWRNEPPNCQNLIGKFGTGKYRIFKPTHVHFDLCPAVFVLGFSHQQMCFQGEVHFHAPIDTVGIWEGFVSLCFTCSLWNIHCSKCIWRLNKCHLGRWMPRTCSVRSCHKLQRWTGGSALCQRCFTWSLEHVSFWPCLKVVAPTKQYRSPPSTNGESTSFNTKDRRLQ